MIWHLRAGVGKMAIELPSDTPVEHKLTMPKPGVTENPNKDRKAYRTSGRWRFGHGYPEQAGFRHVVAEKLQCSELELETDILASKPGFVSSALQAIAAGNEPGGLVDAALMPDLLDERWLQYKHDFATVLDSRGNGVVLLGSVMQSLQEISKTPLLGRERAKSAAASELCSRDGRLLMVAPALVFRGDTLEALLLTGIEVIHAFVDSMANSRHAEVSLIGYATTGEIVLASTLNPLVHPAKIASLLVRMASARSGGAMDAPIEHQLDLGDAATRATVTPIFESPTEGLLVSVVPGLGVQAVRKSPVVAGALLLLLILVLWLTVQRRLVRPLVQVNDMSDLLLRGDIQIVFRKFGNTEASGIGHAFNQSPARLCGYKEAV